MLPNISIRESIRWLPDEPFEPTSTLVLTSSQCRFVDVRILKIASHTLDNPTSQTSPSGSSLPLTRLDWAFAGTSVSEIVTQPDLTKVVHSKWTHLIDSRHDTPDKLQNMVPDEADMYPQPDGTTLEKGIMPHPEHGRPTAYEEVWTDLPSLSTRDDRSKVCVVLETGHEGDGIRGLVVRVGQYCQGIVRIGEEFALERWEWEAGKWRRVARMGDLWVPCAVATEEDKIVVGGEVKMHEAPMIWKVQELTYYSS